MENLLNVLVCIFCLILSFAALYLILPDIVENISSSLRRNRIKKRQKKYLGFLVKKSKLSDLIQEYEYFDDKAISSDSLARFLLENGVDLKED